jgi:hypothetical protein
MVNKKLKNWLGPLTLSLILIIIFAANFSLRTYLIGWDNLMPELNIWMNIKRSLFAVWQEYQGLGLVGGMGHATDLIRQIILLPFVLILPNNWIRYLWHFGMLALGTFGVYFGVKKNSEVFGRSALIAALFYLLNFGTIQIFWVPFEAFTTFWGFFPWLIFSFLSIFKKPNKKNWIKFAVWNILAIPSFYIQTLFVVYGLCLGVISIPWILKQVQDDKRQENLIKAGVVILFVNSFWLLPFGYFLLTNSHHPTEVLINRMSTEETFLRNQRRGYLGDFLTLKDYYYDFPDAGQPLMAPWQNHFSSTPIIIIGYVFGAIVILGLIKAPNWLRGIFLLSAIALLSATPPFSWLNYLLRLSPFLNQVFRSPFTKFIIPAGFSFAVLFSYGINFIINQLKFKKLILGITILGLITYTWPVFQGNLIYSKMRKQLPEKYLQLIDYFKNQPKTGRIANLPQSSFWGWTFYRFGSRGSGFIWYGIEQPIADRAFDVWNLKNERYYWELTYALQNQDLNLLESIFNKYSIEYIVFDDEIIFPENKNWAKLALKTKDLIQQAEFLEHQTTFDNIFVYKKVKKSQTKPYLTANKNYYSALDQIPDYQLKETADFQPPANQEINPGQLEKIDEINLGPEDFINPHHCAAILDESEINYQTKNNEMILTANQTALCLDWENYDYFNQFQSPKLIVIEFEYKTSTDEWPQYCLWDITNSECKNRKDFPKQGFSQEWNTYSETIIFNPENEKITNFSLIADAHQKENQEIKYRNISMKIYQAPPEIKLPMTIENPIETNLVRLQPQTCNEYQQGGYDLDFNPNKYLRLSSVNNNSCYTWAFNHLPLNQSYQVKIKYRNVNGHPLTIAASSLDGQYQIYQNILSDKKDWQTKYFVLPPYNTEQKGIQIRFNNNSFSYQESINDIGSIEIHPADIKYPNPQPPTEKSYLKSKSSIWKYSVSLNDQMLNNKPASSSQGGWENKYLVLPQAYDSGWTAIYFDGWRPRILKNHVLINNWANGWSVGQLKVQNEKFKVYLVFWPQLLQFVGFCLLAGTIVYISIKWSKKRNTSL